MSVWIRMSIAQFVPVEMPPVLMRQDPETIAEVGSDSPPTAKGAVDPENECASLCYPAPRSGRNPAMDSEVSAALKSAVASTSMSSIGPPGSVAEYSMSIAYLMR